MQKLDRCRRCDSIAILRDFPDFHDKYCLICGHREYAKVKYIKTDIPWDIYIPDWDEELNNLKQRLFAPA